MEILHHICIVCSDWLGRSSVLTLDKAADETPLALNWPLGFHTASCRDGVRRWLKPVRVSLRCGSNMSEQQALSGLSDEAACNVCSNPDPSTKVSSGLGDKATDGRGSLRE